MWRVSLCSILCSGRCCKRLWLRLFAGAAVVPAQLQFARLVQQQAARRQGLPHFTLVGTPTLACGTPSLRCMAGIELLLRLAWFPCCHLLLLRQRQALWPCGTLNLL